MEKEKKEAIELEKKRIEDGKAMSSLKQHMADKEIKQIAEDRVREKRENQLAKERVKAQIEQVYTHYYSIKSQVLLHPLMLTK